MAEEENWEKSTESGFYYNDSLSTEGFIHCSLAEDFEETANLHYKNKNNLLVLCINGEKVKPEIKMEMALKRGKLFPHIYGPINVDAVESVLALKMDENGLFILPKNLML
ncbi:MAG TPA: DUF952 domain-containing protein [Bacteroidia bacterium]|nr:DUF952 domain-containing protein [Bacteroidia bacterium]